jgi:uncharacterized protein YheU (UPF0270 family)
MNDGNNGTTLEELSSRVDDIELTIGDIAQVLNSLKLALARIPAPPNCPPYCAHEVTDESEDPLSLADRVKDIKKCIGDVGIVFESLIDSLNIMVPPDCPPYCAHALEE